MINNTFKLASERVVSTAALLAVLAFAGPSWSQTMPADHAAHHPATMPANMSMADQVMELRAKVGQLEAALQRKQTGMAGGSTTGTVPRAA